VTNLLETLRSLNSFVRTLLAVVVVGGVSGASWIGYQTYHAADLELQEKSRALAAAEKKLANFQERIVEQERRIEQLDLSLRLIKVDHRLARITVLDQKQDADTGQLFSEISFVTLDGRGRPQGEEKRFRIRGDVVYVDHWIVKFEDKYIEQAALDRATSICLFRRLFGEFQNPRDGFPLDAVGERPQAYAKGGRISDFEQGIWDDFWNIAHDPARAQELGIRAAHGDAVSTKLRAGKQYRLELRASGGLSITPAEDAPPVRTGPAT